MNPILEWSLKYLKYYSIFPVSRDKKPLLEWKKYQTEKATEEQVRKWFDVPNPPNIGIVTGKISNITVVDVENGGSWANLPSTATVKTGGGGYHLFYRYAPGIANFARIRHLTDIRGDGGYVVGAPSLHASGNRYEWVKKEPEQPFPYQEFGLSPEKLTKDKQNDWDDIIKGIPQGNRNETATKFIGLLLSKFPPSQWLGTVWEMVVLWNLRNDPPLDQRELRATFNSIAGRAARTGGHAKEEPQDCPVMLLSDIAKTLTDDITISYPTGFEVYDKAFMGGLKEGDLVVLSGFTGHGKTLYAQSMTYNLIKSGQPCLWFSFEVPVGELWRKFKDMGVDDGFSAYSPEKTVNRKIDWVVKKIQEARDAFKTKMVFIDHLGFLAEEPNNYDPNITNNFSTRLAMICRKLKSVAIEENVAIILLAHLRKPTTPIADPTLHDLKDSSGIAQEADSVVIINRESANKGRGMRDEIKEDIYLPTSFVRIDKNRRTGQTKIFKVELSEGKLIESGKAFEDLVTNLKQDEPRQNNLLKRVAGEEW